ncbi:globin family protein [Sporocytophaga myxococcoides]|uniref:globin family protein n=1 Tax=Sporocytophaga myxococcoides TaxID=153721 RepID=UPI000568E4F5|nr:globin family protein [Sporocytophaga myxococcoides]
MINDTQISLVKKSWESAYKIQDVAGPLFYNRLFEIAPEVRYMFAQTNLQEQSKKLFQMLNYIIQRLHNLDDIIDEVASLAGRHVKYGVKERHYQIVGEALLWTLEKGLGELWNSETKESWVKTYTILSSAMIGASRILQEK